MSTQDKESIRNQSNIEVLASAVVDGWDQETLIQFARDSLKQTYQTDMKQFLQDWNSYIKYCI